MSAHEPVPSEAALLARVRSGDSMAFAVIYERHVGSAKHLARSLTASEADADDIVAEAFTKILRGLRAGGGPEEAFRAYLLTAVRRTAYDRSRGDRRLVQTDKIERYDRDEPFADPTLEGLERSVIGRAFASLPETWRNVLWHLEVEGESVAEVAKLMGRSPNAVASLAYRAREGLRQAYLQMHTTEGARPACRPALDALGAYVRGGLSARQNVTVQNHLRGCSDCAALSEELNNINGRLRGIAGPVVASAATSTGVLVHWWKLWWEHHGRPVVIAGSVVAVIVASLYSAIFIYR